MIVISYGQFLLAFLLIPVIGLALLVARDWLRAGAVDGKRYQWLPLGLLLALVILAIVYTAPWDNHLIASGVWWYSPSLVSGVTLGVIPLEEVLFFPLETILIGLWVLWLIPRVSNVERVSSADDCENRTMDGAHTVGTATVVQPHARAGAKRDFDTLIRWIAVALGSAVWLAGLLVLLRAWRPGTYVGWELVWALPPILLQWGLGGDILWRRRRLLLAALLPAVVYLSATDAFAIHQGIWTISPHWSLGLLVGGVLPLEELLFFLLTSALITGGLILGSSPEMRSRLHFGARSHRGLVVSGRPVDARHP